ncbi:MAG TPA: LPS export ABC transporter periplasmic protein LptC [bacterium]|nr:LPS export ABC transporter periplasmic protein LptC [bacterium]HOL47034.1 LPS export ABC transporter periplasmic protein LptC [bacterium]HPQ18464.1 LPS export ABC transporter periplasmic protein LptC [bacterium]
MLKIILLIIFLVFANINIFANEKLYDIKDFVISEMKESEKLWDLNAKQASVLKNENILVKNFYLILYKGGTKSATITGLNGTIFKNKNIEIRNNVNVKNVNGVIINTEYLFWDNSDLSLSNDTYVTVIKENNELFCKGIKYFDNKEYIKFLNEFQLKNRTYKNQYVKSNRAEYYVNKGYIKLTGDVSFIYNDYTLQNDFSEIFIDEKNNFKSFSGFGKNKLLYYQNKILSDTLFINFIMQNKINSLNFIQNVRFNYDIYNGQTNDMLIKLNEDQTINEIIFKDKFLINNDTIIINGRKSNFNFVQNKIKNIVANTFYIDYKTDNEIIHFVNILNEIKIKCEWLNDLISKIFILDRSKIFINEKNEIIADNFEINFDKQKKVNQIIIKKNIIAQKDDYKFFGDLLIGDLDTISIYNNLKMVNIVNNDEMNSEKCKVYYNQNKKIDKMVFLNLNNSMLNIENIKNE